MTRDAVRVASLLFFSGLSALVYQTVWLREFRLIFGASTYATGAVLAIFMFGLGLGSALLGKRADAKEQPLQYYARLELYIAAAAAASPFLLAFAAKVYFASGGSPSLGIGGATVLRLLLATLILGPATLLMGGTLPAAARAVQTNDDSGRRAVALLYGVNTLGAVAGTLISTFLLLEQLGNRTTLLIAVGVNVVVALVARRMTLGGRQTILSVSEEDGTGRIACPPPAFVYAASALVGFAFLLMELVWYRMLSPILGGTTYMFGLVLAVALAGIAAGGALYALRRRGEATIGAFAVTCSLEALAIIIPFALGDRIALLANVLRGLGILGFDGHIVAWVLVTGIVVFPAAVIAGIQFPILIALLGRGREGVGRQIGAAYAWNTAGAIAGSLAGGFGLMPLLSAPGTWRLVTVVLALLGAAAMLLAFRERQRFASIATAATAVAALVLCIGATGPTAVWRHSGIGAARAPELKSRNELRRWIHERRQTLLWDRDGRESSVALVALRDIAFIVNGKSDGSARVDAGTQVMAGLVGAISHPRPRTALVVGLGTGSTSGWLAAVPTIQRVDTVELEPIVLDVARACSAVNHDAMSSPKMHITIGDAREVLLTTDRRYDVISSEPSNPYRAGIASLFTREFYLAARSRLNGGGVFAQWIQTYAVHPETIRTVYATLTGVFPYVHTWWTTGGDMVLVASMEPVVFDAGELRARLRTEPFRSAAMNAWRVDTAEGFLARLFANEDFARAAAKQAEEINTDDRTVIEFGFARSIDAGTNLHEQIARDATRLRASRPRVRGAIDWEAVERLRPWVPRGEHPPRTVGELALHAIEAAKSGEARAEEWAKVVAQVQPVEADLILATLRSRQNRLDEATALLRRSLIGYRRTAWPQPAVMDTAFPLALDLAHSSPQRARAIYEAMSEPFAAMQLDNSRAIARIAIAPLFDRCGPTTMAALRAVEPHPVWTHEMLTIRANCYALARHELADRAWKDLARYVAAAPTQVVR